MKSRAPTHRIADQIRKFAPDMGGVFLFADLWNMIGLNSSDRTAKVVARLVRDGILQKIRRGIYITESPDLWVLASRIKKQACISMDSVLSRNGLTGTLTARTVSATYPGKPMELSTSVGRLRFFQIKRDLLFGIEKKKHGVLAADNEKAFLDLLYYYAKGARFVIDPLQDVDLWKLERKKLAAYLRHYKNPKFKKFVENIIHEQKQ